MRASNKKDNKPSIPPLYVGVGIVVLALVSLSLMFGGGMMGGWGNMMNGYNGSEGGSSNQGSLWMVVTGAVFMVIFWGVIISFVVSLLRNNSQHPDKVVDDNAAGNNLALLSRRYAAGEITKEQYENARETLRV